tara:strand:- start:7019 stop:7840 length:822 start_codon:yes stop_codon:yes gene_type:complete
MDLLKKLNKTEFKVFIYLQNIQKQGVLKNLPCSEIVRNCSISNSTAKEALNQLEKLSLILKVKKDYKLGNSYNLLHLESHSTIPFEYFKSMTPSEFKFYYYVLKNNLSGQNLPKSQIKEDINLSKDAINSGIKNLENKKLISVEMNYKKGNIYNLSLSNLQEEPENNKSKLNKLFKKGFIYVIGASHNPQHIKVGVTTRDIDSRLKEIQTGNPLKLEIISYLRSDKYLDLESYIHKTLQSEKDEHMHGEWFNLSDFTIKTLKNLGLLLDLKEA